MTTLVEQGIVPEYKTSPSLHLQRTKLERAKTGDILKSRCHAQEVNFYCYINTKHHNCGAKY